MAGCRSSLLSTSLILFLSLTALANCRLLLHKSHYFSIFTQSSEWPDELVRCSISESADVSLVMSCAFFVCYTLVGIQDDMYVSASQISLLVLLSRRLYDDFCRSSLLLLRVKSMCSSSALALSYYICISYHLVQEFIVFHLSCFFLLLRFHFDSIVRKCFYVEFIHVACTCVVLLVPWEIILLGSVGWLPPNDNPFLVHVFSSFLPFLLGIFIHELDCKCDDIRFDLRLR